MQQKVLSEAACLALLVTDWGVNLMTSCGSVKLSVLPS